MTLTRYPELMKLPDRQKLTPADALWQAGISDATPVAATQSPDVEENLRRQIAATDRAIDALVYQLYGLTAEEIALVESATAPQAAEATA